MLLRFLVYGLLFYLAFRLVFNFIIPLFRTTHQIRQQFKDVHNRMQDQMNNPHHEQAPPRDAPRPQKVDREDYIEFEEIKEK